MKKTLSIAAAIVMAVSSFTAVSAKPEIIDFASTNYNFLHTNGMTEVTGSVPSYMAGYAIENAKATAVLSKVNRGTEENPDYALNYSNTAKNAYLQYTYAYWSSKNKAFSFDLRVNSGSVRIGFRDNANNWRTDRSVLEFSSTGKVNVWGSVSSLQTNWEIGKWYNVKVIIDNSDTSAEAPDIIEIREGSGTGALIGRYFGRASKPSTAQGGAGMLTFITQSENTSYTIDNLAGSRVYDNGNNQCNYPDELLHFVADGKNVTDIADMRGKHVQAEYSVKDAEFTAVNPMIVTAAYDADGKLTTAFASGVSLESCGAKKVTDGDEEKYLNISGIDVPSDAARVTSFVWDMNSLKPIKELTAE